MKKNLQESNLRQAQLRVLYQGEKIHVAVANSHVPVEGVDTPEDLAKARAYAKSLG